MYFVPRNSPIHRMPFGVSLFSRDVAFRATLDREIKTVVASKLESVLNSYRCCFANFVSKVPQPDGPAGEVALHQDITFVDESRYQSLGLWCPLTDVDTTNGCLHVIPGSHRLNPGPRGSTVGFPYADLLPALTRKLQPVPMAAGSGLIFCQKLFHASQPNRGTAARVVVGALCAPREAQLYCYYADPASPGRMEVYEVDDLFYTRYILQTRPKGVRRSGEIDYWYKPLTPERLAAFPDAHAYAATA